MLPSPSVSLKSAVSGLSKRKQVTLSTEKKSVNRKSVTNNEKDKENVEEKEVLTVSTIKLTKQKNTKNQPAVNMINLRKPESNKKEENVWKDLLSCRHSNKFKHIEEHNRFDYVGLMEE